MRKLNYIDLGTHSGQEIDLVLEYYKYFEKEFDLTVYGVEANTNLFKGLLNKYENKYRVKLFNNAICENSGKTKLYLSEYKTVLGSSIFPSKKNVNELNFIEVDGYSISDFVTKYIVDFKDSVNVLKLNIEGAELSVYEDLLKNDMIEYIDLFCGHPQHDIEKIPELFDKKERYYSILENNNIKLVRLCGENETEIDRSVNIFWEIFYTIFR